MTLPQAALDQNFEELDSLQTTVSGLFNEFVKPIDAMRSQAWPININFVQTQNNLHNFQVSNVEPFESRIHALYRILSFPVVGGNAFYNPGFVPANLDQSDAKLKIRTSFSQNSALANLLQMREQQALNARNIFSTQDLKGCLWALFLKYPAPMVLFDNSAPLQKDVQKFTVSDRVLEIEKLAEVNADLKSKILQASSGLEVVQKQLKPFITDPRIELTVTPDTKQVCAPFLPDKNACQLQKNVFLSRSGLELILRQRMINDSDNTLFLKQVEDILTQQNSPGIDITTISSFSVVDSLQAISEENKLSNTTKELLTTFSNYQLTIINQLTKYIKFCVKKLVDAIKVIDAARFQMYWFPLPSKDGPITGSVGAKLSSFGLRNNILSPIEQKISELKIKKLNAERSQLTTLDLGTFLSPFQSSNNLENVAEYEEQLTVLERKRNKISDNAFVALSEIEMLVGEVAGIGLIDVLSIYLALWSLDLQTLLHFLDTASFERLVKYNPQFLGVSEVQARKNSGAQMDIEQVLEKFQNFVFNILSYADKVFQGYLFSSI